MNDCIFCKIAARQVSSDIVYEDSEIVAFCDMDPQAPVHVLIIPKEHIASTDGLTAQNCDIVGKIFVVAAKIARDKGLKDGYRIVNNCGPDGGQTVPHLHFHLMGGRKMRWPAG